MVENDNLKILAESIDQMPIPKKPKLKSKPKPKPKAKLSSDNKNWYENHENLYKIYRTDPNGELVPFPTEWNDLKKWFERCIDEDITTNELKTLIKRIKEDDYMCKNNAKELLAKKKKLQKADFNRIWSGLYGGVLAKNTNDDNEDTLNIYHEIENELRKKIDIVSYKREILIKIDNAYTNNLDVLLEYINLLAKQYRVGYKTVKGDILETLKDSNIVNMDFFCYDSWLLNFKNGYYNFITNEFIEAKDCIKEFVFSITRNYNNGEADCPIFKETLDNCLKGNDIISRDDIFEFMSYSLMFGNFLKAFFLNIGETNTGKTQIMEILKTFVPTNNRIQISLQRLTHDQFGSMGLNNIILCYYDDLSDKIINDVSMIKSITGGASEISIEVKHGGKIDSKNTAKIWQNGNYLPKIYNSKDTAYIDRAVIIEFNNQIDRYSKTHKDQFYLTITKNKAEMDGIIAELIKAGKRLHERGNFRESVKNYSNEYYIYKSSEVIAFLKDFTLKSPKSSISFNTTKDLINEYRTDRKKPAFSSQEVKKELEEEGYFKSQTNIDNNREYVIKGLAWKKTKQIQTKMDDYYERNF